MRAFVSTCIVALIAWFPSAAPKACPTDHLVDRQQRGRAGAVDPRTAPKKGAATIRGHVFASQTGRPLRAVQAVATVDDTAVRTAFTDESGAFEMTGLPAGKYRVRASLVGYATLEFGESPDAAGGREIALANNETFDKADFRLPRAGVVMGRIVDEAGEPIEGVQVQLLSPVRVSGVDRLAQVSASGKRTDDLGRYRLFSVPAGDYYVVATPGGFAQTSSASGDMALGYSNTFYPGTTDLSAAQMVSVSGGQETQAAFSLVASRMFDLSGVVLDPTGAPLADAVLTLLPGTTGAFDVFARAGTRDDGTFRFTRLAPGPYVLQAQSRPTPADRRPPLMRNAFASTIVTMAGNVTDVVLQTRPSPVVLGSVVFEGGEPRPSTTSAVVALPIDFARSPLLGTTICTVTPDWTFQLGDVWGPRVIGIGTMPGWMLKAVRVGGIDVTDQPVDFERDRGRVQIVMTSELSDVSGTVFDGAQPAVRAPVIIFASDPDRWQQRSRYMAFVTTDENGRFATGPLPAGEYRVIALSRMKIGTDWRRQQFLESVVRDSQRLVLHEAEHANVDLKVVRPSR